LKAPLALGWIATLALPVQGQLVRQAYEEALQQGRSEGKCVYVAFLGEDWSLSSKRFKGAILQNDAFVKFAAERLIYFPVEARRKPPLTKEETAILQSLVIHFDIKSYPTMIIIAPDGQEILRHTYKEMDAKAYVELLEAVIP
jgi:hypothetical protein